jgi:ceramide glucosyltransferase
MQGWLLVYWIAAGAAILMSALVAWQTWEHRRFVRSRIRNPSITPCQGRVLLVVPCKGHSDDLEANLRPLFEQDHDNYELVISVESLADSACAVIKRLIEQHPRLGARLVVAGVTASHGQKVWNLLAATAEVSSKIDILAFVDDDVRPPSDWLRMLTQRLNEYVASTGYRWFVPARPTFANCLLSSINAAIVPIMFPGHHHKVWGGSWAIRREIFESGGLREAWQGTLSDDLVAGNVLARLKRRITVEPACIVHSPIDMTLGDMFSFMRRQYTIGRFYSPLLWTTMLVYSCATQIALWGIAAAAVWGVCQGQAWAWQPLLATAALYGLHVFRGQVRHKAARYFIGRRWEQLSAARWFDIWLAPVTGLAIWIGLVSSAFGRRITWRGIVYEMGSGGAVRRIWRTLPPVAGARVEPALEGVGQKVAA